MTRRRRAAIVLLALLLAAPAAGTTRYHAPEPEVRTLSNGLTVAVLRDHRLPIVQMQLLLPAGSAMEGPLESGLAAFTAGLLPFGTASRTDTALTADLARLGATIDGNAGREVATLNGAFRTASIETAIELFADIALHPSFPEDAVDVTRARRDNALRQSRHDPSVLADEHLLGLAFAGDGLAHPPGGVLSAIGGLGRAQAQDFHRRFWRPEHALLAIAGDVDPDRVFHLVEEQFGEWGGKAGSPPARESVPPPTGLRIRLVDLPDAPHAEIRLAVAGPPRATRDAEPLVVALSALGGGSRSRLARAGAGVDPRATWSGYRERGLIVLASASRPESVVATVRGLQRTLRGFTSRPPGETELAPVRRRIADGSALGYETLGGWIAQWTTLHLYGAPGDRLSDFPDRVEAVTAGDVGRVATRWLVPEPATLVVVGPARSLRAGLAALGSVEVVSADAAPIALPLAPSQRTDSPTESDRTHGRELIDQAVTAHGGRKALERVTDSVIEGSVTLGTGSQTVSGTFRELRREPQRYLLWTLLQNEPEQSVLNGDQGWVTSGAEGDTTIAADSTDLATLRTDARSDLHHVLATATDPASHVAYRGRERAGGRELDVVEVTPVAGDRQMLFLDPNDHRVAGIEQLETAEDGRRAAVRRWWGDYRLVSGVWWPFSEERRVHDRTIMVEQIKNVKLGAGLTESLFERPAPGAGSKR